MEEKTMPSTARIVKVFVKQYYLMLNQCPENVHKFYQESSLVGWPEADGVVTPVTTLSGIKDKVESSDYKSCLVEIKTTDFQESQDGGVIVTVTGCLIRKDNVKKNFFQTFFLAKQENDFFVLNDLLRVFDVCVSMTDAAGSSDHDNGQSASTKNSAPCDGPKSLNFKTAIQNGNVKEASDHSAWEKNLANGAASTPSIPSVMEEKTIPSTEVVAKAFVAQYYLILYSSPQNTHKFYQESSLLGWPEADGVVTHVTTSSGIKDKVMSSDFKSCKMEIKTTDFQESQGGGIIVTVAGCFTGKDNVKKNFTQTFFLARLGNGFFVLNDLLRIFYVCVPMSDAAGSSDHDNDQSASTKNSG